MAGGARKADAMKKMLGWSATAGLVVTVCLAGCQSSSISQTAKSVQEQPASLSPQNRSVSSPPAADKADLPVIMDFIGDRCPGCETLAPTWRQLQQEYSGRVQFVTVNIDDEPEQVARYHIKRIPLVILFVNGQEVNRWVGPQPAEVYRQALEEMPQPEVGSTIPLSAASSAVRYEMQCDGDVCRLVPVVKLSSQ